MLTTPDEKHSSEEYKFFCGIYGESEVRVRDDVGALHFASLVPGCSPNGCSFLVWREHVTFVVRWLFGGVLRWGR
jgi:hypothetical protein